jgi:hypothetical protein
LRGAGLLVGVQRRPREHGRGYELGPAHEQLERDQRPEILADEQDRRQREALDQRDVVLDCSCTVEARYGSGAPLAP